MLAGETFVGKGLTNIRFYARNDELRKKREKVKFGRGASCLPDS